MRDKLKTTSFAIEATNFEMQMLWERHSKDAAEQNKNIDTRYLSNMIQRVRWPMNTEVEVQNICKIGGDVVTAALHFPIISGYRVLFYNSVTDIAHYGKMFKWVKEHCPNLIHEGRMQASTFYKALSHIFKNEAPFKLELIVDTQQVIE